MEYYGAIAQIRKKEEQKILQKTEEEKEATEAEKLKTEKEQKRTMCARRKKYKLQHQASKLEIKDQREEDKKLTNWEIHRFKR